MNYHRLIINQFSKWAEKNDADGVKNFLNDTFISYIQKNIE
jgi:hypothetical protein